MTTKGMPDAPRVQPFLSEENMLLRDSIIYFLALERKRAKENNEVVGFVELLDRATIRLGGHYKTYYAIPEVVRNAIANKYTSLRLARKEEERLKEVHKHQVQLNFNPIKDDDPPF